MWSLCPVEHCAASDCGQRYQRDNDERQISLHKLRAESEKFRRNESIVKWRRSNRKRHRWKQCQISNHDPNGKEKQYWALRTVRGRCRDWSNDQSPTAMRPGHSIGQATSVSSPVMDAAVAWDAILGWDCPWVSE